MTLQMPPAHDKKAESTAFFIRKKFDYFGWMYPEGLPVSKLASWR